MVATKPFANAVLMSERNLEEAEKPTPARSRALLRHALATVERMLVSFWLNPRASVSATSSAERVGGAGGAAIVERASASSAFAQDVQRRTSAQRDAASEAGVGARSPRLPA